MISVCAQSARLADGHADRVDPAVVARGRDDRRAVPARVARRGRPEGRPGDRHVLDLHRASTVSTPRPSRRGSSRRPAPTARPRSRPRSARSRARSTAARPRGCCRCSTRPPAAPSVEGLRQGSARPRRPADGLRPPRLPRRGSARAAPPRHREGARLAALRGRGRARARGARRAPCGRKSPDRVLATNVEFWSAVVLDVAGRPAAARAGDVRLLAHRRLVGAHPRAEAAEPARAAVGAVRRARPRGRSRRSDGARGGSGARRRARPRAGQREGARDPPRAVGRRARGRRRGAPTTAIRGQAYRAIAPVPLPPEARAHPARARGRERRRRAARP